MASALGLRAQIPPNVVVTSPAAGATITAVAPVSISASATPGPSAYIVSVTFFANGTPLGGPDTTAPYTAVWTPSVPGTYQLTAQAVDSFGASSMSSPVSVTVGSGPSAPVITLQPTNAAAAVTSGSATFTVDATGNPAPTFQWLRWPAGGANFSIIDNGGSYAGATTKTLAISAPTAAMNGEQYRCVVANGVGASVASNVATLTVAQPPVFTSASSVVVPLGAAFGFNVTARSEPAATFTVSGGAFPAWAALNPSTGVISGTPPVTTGSPFMFTLQASNGFQTATHNFTLTVAPITIGMHPASHTVTVGQPATFTVTATGTGLTYQWRRNGLALSGATNASFTLAATQRADADYYDVVITAGVLSVASSAARLVVAPTSYPAGVTADPTYNLKLESGGVTVQALATLADGRVLAGGDFIRVNGHPTTSLARFTANGLIDPTFTAPALDGPVRCIVVQTDGKILVGGDFRRVGGLNRETLARLNVDGSVDPSFRLVDGVGNPVGTPSVQAIAIAADGTLLVAGFGPVWRCSANGVVDPTFSQWAFSIGPKTSMVATTGGKILLGGYIQKNGPGGFGLRALVRLNADGTVDETFDTSTVIGFANSVVPLADGRVFVAGSFGSVGGPPGSPGKLVRLNSNGSPDLTFITPFLVTVASRPVNVMALDGNAKLWVATNLGTVRVNSTGTGAVEIQLPGFVTGDTASAHALLPRSDGGLWVGGSFTDIGTVGSPVAMEAIGRFAPDATVATPVGVTVNRRGSAETLLTDTAGRLLVGGDFRAINGVGAPRLARVTASGAVDSSFNVGSGPDGMVKKLIRLSDGKLLVLGSFQNFAGTARMTAARLQPDGALDPAFTFQPTAASWTVEGATPTRDGQILFYGHFANSEFTVLKRIIRVNPNGVQDGTFETGAMIEQGAVVALVVQPDARIVAGGGFAEAGGAARNRIMRLLPNGMFDPSFEPGTGFDADQIGGRGVGMLQWSSGNRLMVGGNFWRYNDVLVGPFVRLQATGARDSSFSLAASPVTEIPLGMAVQEDDKVLVWTGGATNRRQLFRLAADGQIDPSFQFVGLGSSDLITALVMGDAGQLYYTLLGAGEVRRTIAVDAAPAIFTAPIDQTATVGGTVVLAADIAGAPAPSFQWFKNNVAMAGATRGTLTLASVQSADTGSYTLTATNSLGSVTTTAVMLTVTLPDGADNFDGRASLGGSNAAVTVTNSAASKETGEPNHAGSAGGKSVWWMWTAPQTGHVTIDTIGSNFDTRLAVYTGGAVSSLTLVASDDSSGAPGGSALEVSLIAGIWAVTGWV